MIIKIIVYCIFNNHIHSTIFFMRIALLIFFNLFVLTFLHAQESNNQLKKELKEIYESDQYVRFYADSLSKAHNYQTPDSLWNRAHKLMTSTDSINLLKVERIIAEHGYPSSREVGKYSKAIFFVVQHADLPVQLKYFPLVKEAFERGDIEKQNYAKMVDRMRIREGKKQLYGTQFRIYKGRIQYFEIEAPENLNERRKEMELEPIDIEEINFVRS